MHLLESSRGFFRRKDKMVKRKKPRKKEIKGTTMVTGFAFIAIGIIVLVAMFMAPWITEVIDGESESFYYSDTASGSVVRTQGRLLIASSIGIIALGAVIIFSLFLRETEVITKNTSKWINYTSQNFLLVPALGLIYVGASNKAYMVNVIRTMLDTSGEYSAWFPSPLIVLAFGIACFMMGIRGSKKELKSIKFDELNEKKISKKYRGGE